VTKNNNAALIISLSIFARYTTLEYTALRAWTSFLIWDAEWNSSMIPKGNFPVLYPLLENPDQNSSQQQFVHYILPLSS
jgi:hypothetical protein